jgi:hypothetical protein
MNFDPDVDNPDSMNFWGAIVHEARRDILREMTDGGFQARPSLRACADCPAAVDCPKVAKFPRIDTVDVDASTAL